MIAKRVWWLCTLLPDLPGDSEVASTKSPALRGIGVMIEARFVNKDALLIKSRGARHLYGNPEVNSFRVPGLSGKG